MAYRLEDSFRRFTSWARLTGPERAGTARVVVTVGAALGALLLPTVAAVAAVSRPASPPSNEIKDFVDIVIGRGTTSSTRTSTSTSTTRPVTAAAARAPEPVPSAAAAPAPARAAVRSTDPRCTAAQRAVEAGGLVVPANFDFLCPGNTQMFVGDRQHWGTTCSHASLCPDGAYVAVNPGAIGSSDARLRHVIAHETCHALDVMAGIPLSEPAADACAAAHGFARV